MRKSNHSRIAGNDQSPPTSPPDLALLELADLPSNEDWVLMESLRLDHADSVEVDSDSDLGSRLTIEPATLD